MQQFKTITFHLFLSFFIASGVIAQAPASFNYQAVVRDDAGMVIESDEVTIEVAIVQGSMEGDAVFNETHNTQTNEFGLVNLQIGSINSLEDIAWGDDTYFIKVTLNGEIMGVTQLLSVPYALHSQTSADAFSGDYEDLENLPDLSEFLIISDPEIGDLAYYTEDGWKALPIGSEGQVLAVDAGLPGWIDAPFEEEPGPVSDIDGNVYETVLIGNQLWMAENLRTTKYHDGSDIPTGLSDADWSTTEDGAYAVYPHDNVEGIDSEAEMVEAYGKLYNWYAVEDERGLCPDGWRVATADDYDELVMYVAYWGGMDKTSETDKNPESVAGNYVKSCRQINSPLGGDCDTGEHPRWEADNTHFGTDEFGFDGRPSGYRDENGFFNGIGTRGYFWTSTELSFAMGRWRRLGHDGGWVYSGFEYKEEGYSVRCIKE